MNAWHQLNQPNHLCRREFWQRAEARNRATADLYDKLGLPEYEAIEAFLLFNGKTLNF